MGSIEYMKAGVDLEAGYDVVKRIKKHVAKTNRTGVMSGIGSFGGLFDLASLGYKEPVLVSGTDGVGTKLKLAFAMDKHDTIGEDVVAMCVNDVLAQGAEPLFFLDYVAVGKNHPAKIEQIVAGVANGCVKANCALIGGETAEMPGLYDIEEYDLAGFCVGCAEKKELIGIASSGVHSNGFSLVRKILKDNNINLKENYGFSKPIGEVLLEPTRIYVKPVLKAIKAGLVNGVAHITGGGFDENIPRMIPEGAGILIDEGTWPIPDIFPFLEEKGHINHREMFNIFNMGIGMVLACQEDKAIDLLTLLIDEGERAYIIGQVTKNSGVVIK